MLIKNFIFFQTFNFVDQLNNEMLKKMVYMDIGETTAINSVSYSDNDVY